MKRENIGSYSISNRSGKENFSTAMENHLTITMKHLKNTWTFNSKQLQSILSDVCGHYCVFYLCHRARGHSMKAIVNMFDSNKTSNDTKVFRFVNKHFRISPKIPGEKFSQSSKKLIEESRKL